METTKVLKIPLGHIHILVPANWEITFHTFFFTILFYFKSWEWCLNDSQNLSDKINHHTRSSAFVYIHHCDESLVSCFVLQSTCVKQLWIIICTDSLLYSFVIVFLRPSLIATEWMEMPAQQNRVFIFKNYASKIDKSRIIIRVVRHHIILER